MQEAGDLRRTKLKEDFEAEDQALVKLDAGLRALTSELESAAAEAERAAAAETVVDAGSDGAAAPSARSADGGPALRRPDNPYSEYRAMASQSLHGAHLLLIPPFNSRFSSQ